MIRSLHRKKERYRQALFLVEGMKPVSELLKSERKVRFVAGTRDHLDALEGTGSSELPFLECDEDTIEECSTLQHPEAILAVAEIPSNSFDPADLSGDRPLLCCESLNDPGNLGTLLRVADHFGLEDLLFSTDSVDPYNPKVVRSSMGSLFRHRVHRMDLFEALKGLRNSGRKLVATDTKGASLYTDPLPKDAVLFFGNESRGLSRELLDQVDDTRSLPPLGKVESLNVAVAAGIFCSELLREEFM